MNIKRLFIIVCCVLTLGSGAPSQADILDFMPAIIAGATVQTAAMSEYFIFNTDIYDYGEANTKRIVAEPTTLPGITGLIKQTIISGASVGTSKYYKWQGSNLYIYAVRPTVYDRIDIFDSPVNLGSTMTSGINISETRNTTTYDSEGTELGTGTMTLEMTVGDPEQVNTNYGTFSAYRVYMKYTWSSPTPGVDDVISENIVYMAKDAGIVQYTFEDFMSRSDYPLSATSMDVHLHDVFTLNTPSRTFTEASSGDVLTVTYQDVLTSQGTFKEMNMSVNGSFTLGDMLAYDADEKLFFYGRRNAEKLVVFDTPKCTLGEVAFDTNYSAFTYGTVYEGATGNGSWAREKPISGQVKVGSAEPIAGIQCYSIRSNDADVTYYRKGTTPKNFYDDDTVRITYWFNPDEGLVQIETYQAPNGSTHTYLRSDLVGL